MKPNNQISRFFFRSFGVLALLVVSANFVFSQCGNYFKTKYAQSHQLNNESFQTDAFDDWTGDGRSDIWNFRTNPVTLQREAVIYPSRPTGYWDRGNPIIYTMTDPHYQLGYSEIRDFNSDGRMDLLHGFQIHRNNGNGLLSPTPSFLDSDYGYMEVIGFAHLNADNLLDVAYVLTDTTGGFPGVNHLRYQTQNSDGSFTNKNTILTGNGLSREATLGDFNGDGKMDIIYYTSDLGGFKHVIILNRGSGNFEPQPPVASEVRANARFVRDFNNDGKADVFNNDNSGNLVIYYGQADGTLDRRVFPNISGWHAAELNGDNNLDLISFNSTFYTITINNGAGGFDQTTYQRSLGGITENIVRIEDFSGDGKADLLYKHGGDQLTSLTNLFGERLLFIKENVCQSFGETKVANFDGDYLADVTAWDPNTGNWSLKNAQWESAGNTPPVRNFRWGAGSLGDVPSPGDFDGDGKTDYSVYRNSTGIWYIFRSSDSGWMSIQFGLSGDIPVPNDYDGGGKSDIAVFRPSEGNWYIWQSETQQFAGVHFGQNGDKPVPADYDGDGKTDIAVFRPSNGVWYYLKTSDGNFGAFHWGIETDIPMPADYDGDLKADFTVYRNGVWWIVRSSNNTYAPLYWGISGDVPTPIYRNSISADLIVYRPSQNRWFNYRDTYSMTNFTMNGNQGTPVYFGLPNN